MPKNIKELRAARTAKAKRGQEATARFNLLGAQTTRSAEEETEMTALGAELDTLEADVAQIDLDIVKEEAAARRGALFNSAAPGGEQRQFGAGGRTVSEPNPESTGGFKSMGEFAQAVVQTSLGYHDTRLGATTNTYNSNGGGGNEGFLVPPEYSAQVWDIAFENTDLLGMSKPEPTTSNSVFKPKDETTPWGAVGVQAAWRTEGQQLLATKLAVTGELMTLHELYAFCAASSEVLSDAPMLQDRLTRQAGNAIQWKASDAIMYGDGAGKPLGFMKAPSLITVAKDVNQAAKTLSVPNLANMVARVLRTGGKPMWIINPDVLPQLVTLVIPGTTIPAYLPNNQPLSDSPWDGYLMGYPVLFSEHAQTLGTAGDVTCANMAGYYSVTKGSVDFASSIHPVLRPEPDRLPVDLPPDRPTYAVQAGAAGERQHHQVSLRGPRHPGLIRRPPI